MTRKAQTLFSRVCACMLFLLLASPLSGAEVREYYVSPRGRDTHNGTRTRPWRTLQHAAESASLGSSGTVIHVAPGDYYDMGYCSVSSLVNTTAMVCMQRSGSPTRPITFESEQKWQAHLRCSKSSAMFVLMASYIRIVGFDMSCPAGGSFAGATYGDNGHNEFVNNYLHDFDVLSCSQLGVLNGTIGAQPGSTNIGYHLVSGNIIRHAGAPAGAAFNCNKEHGLYFSDPYDILTNNIISGMIGVGIHSYGGGICHQVISNNTIFNNSQGGVIIENIAAKDSKYWDECENGGRSDYNTVTNNIIVHNGIGQYYKGNYGGIDGRGLSGGGHNVFSNNLIVENYPYETALVAPDASRNQLSGKLDSIFENFQPDPNWAPASPYDFRNYALKSGSVAIDAGTGLCAPDRAQCSPVKDVAGTQRPQGKANDAGAFEFVPSSLRGLFYDSRQGGNCDPNPGRQLKPITQRCWWK